jgi:hypothetical protein
VRELRNAIDRALLTAAQPPPPQRAPMLYPLDVEVPFKVATQQVIDEFDRMYVLTLLAKHDYNVTAAARAAGVERMTIYNIVRRLGLERDGMPPARWDDGPERLRTALRRWRVGWPVRGRSSGALDATLRVTAKMRLAPLC